MLHAAHRLMCNDFSFSIYSVNNAFGFASSPAPVLASSCPEPPIVPFPMTFAADLLNENEDDDREWSPGAPAAVRTGMAGRPLLQREASTESTNSTGAHPPSFSDLVKRSSRFITTVPAAEVMEKVYSYLISCRDSKEVTPVGLIGQVVLNWEAFRLEVWSASDCTGPALCVLQIYQVPPTYAPPSSSSNVGTPERGHRSQNQSSPCGYFGSGSGSSSDRSSPSFGSVSYLVEFRRGQVDIFDFKRFYQWVRHRLTELVKQDCGVKHLDQAFSPQ